MDKKGILNWTLALVIMAAIFLLSSQPSHDLPNFGLVDVLIKKSGHMLGYGLLALSYWNALGGGERKRMAAWLLAVLYAVTDEVHQSFVPGRHASIWDVVIFDNLGAIVSLWVAGLYLKQKRPGENA